MKLFVKLLLTLANEKKVNSWRFSVVITSALIAILIWELPEILTVVMSV